MNKSNLKVMTVVGTRPEIIRLSSTIKQLDKHVNHMLVHTGQNYDYELSDIFFEDLELRKPDIFMESSRDSLGATIGDIIRKSERIFLEEKPDALLVLGDTNSALSAYMAKRLHIPIYHMEAGNRCFDVNVPEETNRRIIDHLADFNLVYTQRAREHLLSEGLPHRRIYLTGSPMNEVITDNKEKINNSDVLEQLGLERGKYFIVSVHREENVDYDENLQAVLTFLTMLAEVYGLRIIVSTHPRTKKRLNQIKHASLSELIRFMKPFSFSDYNSLQVNSKCVISDSGTISEESAILNFPAVTIRKSMERPEAMDAGTIILTGLEPINVLDSVNLAISESKSRRYRHIPEEYMIKDTSWRVLKLILGTAKLMNVWDNIQSNTS